MGGGGEEGGVLGKGSGCHRFTFVKLKISSTSYSKIVISMIFVIHFRFSFLFFFLPKLTDIVSVRMFPFSRRNINYI